MSITDSTISKILDVADITKVIGAKVELKKLGSNLTGKCPFHEEKSPSFIVSPSKDIYKCFGCGEGGNVIKFVMEHERMDFVEAIHHLAKEFSVTVEETVEREDKEIRDKRKLMLDMNRAASKRYREQFMGLGDDHWAKVMIFKERELTMDSVAEFQLGFAPQTNLLKDKIVNAGLYSTAEELGLLKKNDQAQVYDFFRNRIVFPIHDRRGDVIGFSARKLNDNNKANPKFVNSLDTMVYRKSGVLYGLYQAQKFIRKMDHAILVEGNIDVIMMHQAGVTNTVGTCGTAFTESMAQVLSKLCTRVTLMFDGDEAGQKATLKAIDILLMAGLAVNVVKLPENDDPDTLVKGLLAPVPKDIPANNRKKKTEGAAGEVPPAAEKPKTADVKKPRTKRAVDATKK